MGQEALDAEARLSYPQGKRGNRKETLERMSWKRRNITKKVKMGYRPVSPRTRRESQERVKYGDRDERER